MVVTFVIAVTFSGKWQRCFMKEVITLFANSTRTHQALSACGDSTIFYDFVFFLYSCMKLMQMMFPGLSIVV